MPVGLAQVMQDPLTQGYLDPVTTEKTVCLSHPDQHLWTSLSFNKSETSKRSSSKPELGPTKSFLGTHLATKIP